VAAAGRLPSRVSPCTVPSASSSYSPSPYEATPHAASSLRHTRSSVGCEATLRASFTAANARASFANIRRIFRGIAVFSHLDCIPRPRAAHLETKLKAFKIACKCWMRRANRDANAVVVCCSLPFLQPLSISRHSVTTPQLPASAPHIAHNPRPPSAIRLFVAVSHQFSSRYYPRCPICSAWVLSSPSHPTEILLRCAAFDVRLHPATPQSIGL
jgi:hypothetical protein